MTDKKRHHPVSDRARRRAIRARAAQAGVPYSVAARHLTQSAPLELPASRGRTIYPTSSDEHRRWLITMRERRPYDQRVRDTRRAADLPAGRAQHLIERFPSTRGEPGTGVGPLYHGENRLAALTMLYTVVAHERPQVNPGADELAWIAELGEETAVDIACASLDRTARSILDHDRWAMWCRIEAALTAGEASSDRAVRRSALALGVEFRAVSLRTSMDGARHTLDALLAVGDDGHAPGTRVRIRIRPHRGQTATIVAVQWGPTGPPVGYQVRPDGIDGLVLVTPDQLTLLEDSAEPVPLPS
jgi:hypothetical protein